MSRSSGFTLVELLVAIGVTAIAIGTLSPVAGTLRNHYRLAGAARELAFDIGRARLQAIGQNQAIRFVTASGGYQRQQSTDGVTYHASGGDTRLPAGVVLTAGESGMPRFDRQGLAQATTVLTLSGAAGQRTVTTNVLGRASVQ